MTDGPWEVEFKEEIKAVLMKYGVFLVGRWDGFEVYDGETEESLFKVESF